ncbi:hypothetical protein GGF46_005383 [Coemansia sp. RSA 552]|nr:hypothetical protein GGF46_005383 [Coemansia sp. RSA 552]
MATAYDTAAVAATASRHRHKRKGTPRRSPCQRDMVEAPGVVFRFPDKISPAGAPTRDLPGLAILPSAAGLPSGLGTKSAAAVIAAAAAVSESTGRTAPTAPVPAAVTAAGAARPTTAAATAMNAPATMPAAHSPSHSPALTAVVDLPAISSASSTPILRPALAAVPIHRSASNVLHYPELLSDLRDRLIQANQTSAHAGSSSGGESDSGHSHPTNRRAKARRSAKPSDGSDTSPARRSGLRGVSGSAANRSSPGPSGAGLRTRHASETAESVTSFHRRHSIGTIRQQDDEEDGAEPSAHAKSAKRKRSKDSSERHSRSPAPKRQAPQTLPAGVRRCCGSCGATSTPCWRPGLIKNITLCNQCGLRFKKGGVYCGTCYYVPTKTEIATGGASVCKHCTTPMHRSVPAAAAAHDKGA